MLRYALITQTHMYMYHVCTVTSTVQLLSTATHQISVHFLYICVGVNLYENLKVQELRMELSKRGVNTKGNNS